MILADGASAELADGSGLLLTLDAFHTIEFRTTPERRMQAVPGVMTHHGNSGLTDEQNDRRRTSLPSNRSQPSMVVI
jgi:hypothetical protein